MNLRHLLGSSPTTAATRLTDRTALPIAKKKGRRGKKRSGSAPFPTNPVSSRADPLIEPPRVWIGADKQEQGRERRRRGEGRRERTRIQVYAFQFSVRAPNIPVTSCALAARCSSSLSLSISARQWRRREGRKREKKKGKACMRLHVNRLLPSEFPPDKHDITPLAQRRPRSASRP